LAALLGTAIAQTPERSLEPITVTLITENNEKNSEKPTRKTPAQPRKPRNLAARANG
jgi:hypothetical protein